MSSTTEITFSQIVKLIESGNPDSYKVAELLSKIQNKDEHEHIRQYITQMISNTSES